MDLEVAASSRWLRGGLARPLWCEGEAVCSVVGAPTAARDRRLRGRARGEMQGEQCNRGLEQRRAPHEKEHR